MALRSRILLWTGVAFAVVILILGIGLGLLRIKGIHDVQIPPHLGNRPQVIDKLQAYPADHAISFAVVGDTKSFGTFESIMKRLSKFKLDFIVNLGDFVHEPTPWEHLYFIHEVSEFCGPADPPMLLLPGNHDVDPGRFTVGAFESLYGPVNLSFTSGGNYFVILNNALRGAGFREERNAFLQQALSSPDASRARHIFVMMHKPPIDPTPSSRSRGKGRLMKMLMRYGVDYVLCSHLHRFAMADIGPTRVIITGGGGAHLDTEARSGRFHHALVFHVEGQRVTMEIVAVPSIKSLAEWTEHLFFRLLSPGLGGSPLSGP